MSLSILRQLLAQFVGWMDLLGDASFNPLVFLGTTKAFWICTPGRMLQIESPALVLHTLSRRQAMLVQTG
jgi:hypothetical protein